MHWFLGIVSGAAHTLAGASLVALIAALVLHLGKVAAEARSWHAIVRHAYPEGSVRYRTSLGAFAGAIGANAILPARVGEALRLGIMRRRVPGSTVGTIAGTIVLETAIEVVFGLLVIGAMLVAGRSVGPVSSPVASVQSHPLILATLGGGAILLGLVAWLCRRRLGRVTASLARGMSVARAPGPLLRGVIAWKLVAWTFRFATVYFFLVAFHVGGGLWAVLLVVAAREPCRAPVRSGQRRDAAGCARVRSSRDGERTCGGRVRGRHAGCHGTNGRRDRRHRGGARLVVA